MYLLLAIGILALVASGVLYYTQPGLGSLVTLLGALGAFVGSWLKLREKRTQVSVAKAESPRKPVPYEILPISFELWLRQQIPQIDIWIYVVNFQAKELVIETFQIPHFHIQSSPNIDKISLDREVVVPPRQWTSVRCNRRLIDSEARAIEQSLRQASSLVQPNATFSVTTRAYAGHKRFSDDRFSLSMNGWARDIPLHGNEK